MPSYISYLPCWLVCVAQCQDRSAKDPVSMMLAVDMHLLPAAHIS